MDKNFLSSMGWNPHFQDAFAASGSNGQPARVASEYQGLYRLYTEQGERLGRVSGRFRFQASGRQSYPAVGDWVVIDPPGGEGEAVIQALLPRQSKFARKMAGKTTEEQVVAANVDSVFLVTALNRDFNLRRLERYLILAWESGANPVIVLNKTDLCPDLAAVMDDISSIAAGVPVHPVCGLLNEGLEALGPYLGQGRTVALLGSSGVGKSTLVNRLLGDESRRVREVREGDDRGRHTTTTREMIRLPQGGLLIDTPGMRELQMLEAGDGFREAFDDIEELSLRCRFRDCSHQGEPGCAIQEALDSGELNPGRYQNYLKIQKEMAYLVRKEDPEAQRAEKEKWKKIHQDFKHRPNRPN